ncbi:hypothetical protein [Streptomyces hebeiensis]
MGDVLLSLFLAALLMAGFIYPAVHGRLVRRRGYDPDVWPHHADRYAELDERALNRADCSDRF